MFRTINRPRNNMQVQDKEILSYLDAARALALRNRPRRQPRPSHTHTLYTTRRTTVFLFMFTDRGGAQSSLKAWATDCLFRGGPSMLQMVELKYHESSNSFLSFPGYFVKFPKDRLFWGRHVANI